jgi:intracellular sulfur oxidation DsrE/DsrF family protein
LLYRSNPFVIASVLCFICGTSLSILLHFPFIRRSNLIRVSLNGLIKRGVQFAVCQMATRAIAGKIAKDTGAKTDIIFKEIGANLIGNARLVPAGILAVNRAQEWGYSFAYAM